MMRPLLLVTLLGLLMAGCPSDPPAPPAAKTTPATGAAAASSGGGAKTTQATKTTAKPTARPPARVRLSIESDATDWLGTEAKKGIDGRLGLASQQVQLALEGEGLDKGKLAATRKAICGSLKPPLGCSQQSTEAARVSTLTLTLNPNGDKVAAAQIKVSGRLYLEGARLRELPPGEPGPTGPEVTLTLSASGPIAPGVAPEEWLAVAGREAVAIWTRVTMSKLTKRLKGLPRSVQWSVRGLNAAALHERGFASSRVTQRFFADRLWQVRHYDQAWVVDIYTTTGARATHVFQDPGQGTPGQPWVSQHGDRLLITASAHQPVALPDPASADFKTLAAPGPLCNDAAVCPGIAVVAIDKEGAGSIVASSSGHLFRSRAVGDATKNIHVAASKPDDTTVVLLTITPDGASSERPLPQPEPGRDGKAPTYAAYDLQMLSGSLLLIQNGQRLWTLDLARKGEEPRELYKWNGWPSEVAPDGAGGVVLFDADLKLDSRGLRRVAPPGRVTWSQPLSEVASPKFIPRGSLLEAVGVGLYDLRTGRPALKTEREQVAPLKGGGYVACGDKQVVHLDARGEQVAALPLPWDCAAIHVAADGTLLVSSLPVGAYGVAPPELWEAP